MFLCASRKEVRRFTNNPGGYLRLILRAGNSVPIDQLLVAHIQHTYVQRGDDSAWVLDTVRELVELLRSNYDLLIPVLETISEALPELPVTE